MGLAVKLRKYVLLKLLTISEAIPQLSPEAFPRPGDATTSEHVGAIAECMLVLLQRSQPVLDAIVLLEAATILRGMLKRARESRGDFRVFLNVQLRRLTTSASAAEEASSTV